MFRFSYYTFFHENTKCFTLVFNENRKCLYPFLNEITKCFSRIQYKKVPYGNPFRHHTGLLFLFLLFNILRRNNIHARIRHIFKDHIPDMNRSRNFNSFERLHTFKDLALRDIFFRLHRYHIDASAGHPHGRSYDSRRICHFFSCVYITALACISGDAHHFFPIHYNCKRAAHHSKD